MTPQIIYLVLLILGLLIVIVKDGQPRDPYNFWETLSSTLLCNIILYWGGFWGPLFN